MPTTTARITIRTRSSTGDKLIMSPPGLRFLSVIEAAIRRADASVMEIALRYEEGARAVLRARLDAQGRFALDLVPAGNQPAIAFFRLRLRVDPAEAFYGLGEYFDSVNHRGSVRAMQLELDTAIESSNNEAHVPIPFLIGTRGWGVFVESPLPGRVRRRHAGGRSGRDRPSARAGFGGRASPFTSSPRTIRST